MYNKIRIFYLPRRRDDITPPEVTLAIRETAGYNNIGFAVCSENDNFEKRKGRELAINRLNSEPLPFNSISDVKAIIEDWDKYYAPVSRDTIYDLYEVMEKVNIKNNNAINTIKWLTDRFFNLFKRN